MFGSLNLKIAQQLFCRAVKMDGFWWRVAAILACCIYYVAVFYYFVNCSVLRHVHSATTKAKSNFPAIAKENSASSRQPASSASQTATTTSSEAAIQAELAGSHPLVCTIFLWRRRAPIANGKMQSPPTSLGTMISCCARVPNFLAPLSAKFVYDLKINFIIFVMLNFRYRYAKAFVCGHFITCPSRLISYW